MKNTKLYPFERNRYYAGKMLTSADFQAEQAYFNNKRRFINTLMYGSGIVCGCGVFSLDDLSLLVESGVAIDGLGREIVVESSVVKKLSAIEGFDTLQTNLASLCLRYREDQVHTVYTMNQGAGEDGREYEYNRISEGYQLFLMDSCDTEDAYEMETEFLLNGILFADDDFRVSVNMPSSVCRGRNVKLEIRAEKLSSENKKLTYHGVLQTPVFLNADGEHETEIVLEDIVLSQGEVLKKEYWFMVQDISLADTSIVLKNGSARAFVDETAIPAESGFSMRIQVSECKPGELVNREIGRMSLEMKNIGGVKEYIRLADLKLVRTDSAYIIEEVLEKSVKQYITAPAQENLRSEYMEYFTKEADILRTKSSLRVPAKKNDGERETKRGPEVATGLLEIPLGENARKGDIRYSGEIMHGLGKGNVYVDIGYEYISEDRALGTNAKSTIYGNSELFKNDRSVSADAETAVKVLNDKGSFIVAAKLKQNVDFLVLTYRWVAIRFPSDNDLEQSGRYDDKSISTDTPTVVLGTKDSHYFHVTYNNMDACSVAYELTEPGSGEITSDGVYTAPAKEGVYEIRIYCVDMPVICTYAYAIVKKKSFDESE